MAGTYHHKSQFAPATRTETLRRPDGNEHMPDMQIRSSAVLASVGTERNRHSYVTFAAADREARTPTADATLDRVEREARQTISHAIATVAMASAQICRWSRRRCLTRHATPHPGLTTINTIIATTITARMMPTSRPRAPSAANSAVPAPLASYAAI
jgi:hypothetical protein